MQQWFRLEMEGIALATSILGILATKGKPLSLADIYREITPKCGSKPTVYRHLQKLVTKGLVSQEKEKYILIHGGDSAVVAADLARISGLKPILHDVQKGFSFTVYRPESSFAELDYEGLKKDIECIIKKHLTKVIPNLEDTTTGQSGEVLKKLIGLRVAFVASFDGTDFATLTSKDADLLVKKRREVLNLLADSGGITINELCSKLKLNVLQVRQVVDPILLSGFAEMDESGRIRLAVEVKGR